IVPSGARVGLSELHIDGVQALRRYRLPTVPGGGTAVMTRAPGRLPACMPGPIRWVCSPQLQRQDEEGYAFDRTFTAPAATKARLTGTAALTDTALIQRYMSTDPHVGITASSASTNEPAGMARSAFDGDATTTWIPADGDTDPTLALRWRRATVVRKITVRRPPGASGLLNVRVEGDRGQWREGVIGADGVLTVAPMRTARLTLRFPGETPQVTDIVIPHVPTLRRLPAANLSLRCGLGPRLRVNGVTVPTRASGSFADVLAGRPPARDLGLLTVALLGGDGGDIAGAADHQIVVPSGDPRVVKEVHVTAYHVLWELVHVLLEQPGVLGPGVIA
ncbi:hypothetical protein ACFFNX_47965, partial [Actinoallomurus acaciae]